MGRKFIMDFQTFRMYSGKQEDYNYLLSIIADEFGAVYVVPDDNAEIGSVFNLFRLENLREGLTLEELPKTPEDWAILASYNSGRSSVFPMEGAIYSSPYLKELTDYEQEYANKTFLEYRSVKDQFYKDESRKARGIFYASIDAKIFTYALVSDHREIVGIFQNTEETGDVLRIDGGWGDPTWEQIQEWDGFETITIKEEFVEIYDGMLAEGEEVTLETIRPYRVNETF
jgi:hypothetical protein